MTRNTKIKIWAVIGSIFLILSCIAVIQVLKHFDYPIAAGELPQAEREAREAGIPFTVAELNLPPRNYATSKDALAFGDFSATGKYRELSPLYSDLRDLTPNWAASQASFAKFPHAFDAIRTMAKEDRFSVKKDWDLGVFVPFDEFQDYKNCVKALAAHAMLMAKQGDIRGSVSDLKLCQQIGRACSAEGTMLGLLVNLAMDAITLRAAETCLAFAANNEAGLSLIADQILKEPDFDLDMMLRTEAYLSVATIRNLHRTGGATGFMSLMSGGKTPSAHGPILKSGMPSGMDEKAYMTRALQSWTPVMKAMRGKQITIDLVNEQKERETTASKADHKGLSYMLMGTDASSLSRVMTACLHLQADARAKLALCRALQYKLRHGSFPTTLKVADTDLTDPFDNKPLRYLTKGNEVIIWSIGSDLVDNGGKRKKVGAITTDGTDVVTSFPPSSRLHQQ